MPPRAQAFRFRRPVPYPAAAAAMDRLVEARLQNRIPDMFLFLEHEPVVTLGNRGSGEFLLLGPDELKRRGVHLAHATRGGDVTYHGPGQLVVYPILALGPGETDTHRYMANLEEACLRTCADYGVAAHRVPGKTGAWTERGKIAAMGVRIRRWVTSHGLSFNVDVDLAYTDWIIPCGLVGQPVTSLRQILAETAPSLDEVAQSLFRHLGETLGRDVTWSNNPLPETLSDLSPYRA